MRGLVCLWVVVCAAEFLWADTLQFRDGSTVNGTFEGADRTRIRFRPDHSRHIRVFARSRVANIIFGNGSTAATGTPVGTATATPANTAMPPNTPMPQNTPMAVVTPEPGRAFPSTNIRAGGNIVPAGTPLLVRVGDAIDVDASRIGDNWQVTLAQPVVVNGNVVAPAGSTATLQLVGVGGGNRLTGTGDVTLRLVSFTGSTGQTYNTVSSDAVVADRARTVLSGQHIRVRAGALLTVTLQQNVDL